MRKNSYSALFEQGLHKLIGEVKLFGNDEDVWRTQGTVTNSAGNLVLHIIGNLNHHIGATLGKTGYVRNRNLEFAKKGVKRNELIDQLEVLLLVITRTLNQLGPDQMEAEFPIFIDQENASTEYVLTQLLLHLNYHLGQVNYIRRVFE